MAEVFSSGNISKPSIKIERSVVNNTTGNDRIMQGKNLSNETESHLKFLNPDIFTSAVDIERAKSETLAVQENNSLQKNMFKKSGEFSETFQKSMPSLPEPSKVNLSQTTAFTLLSALQARLTDPFIKIRQNTDRRKQEFIDITDKLAAIYGEKEKDLKDKLSDTFKRLFPMFFSSTGPVETSMGQKQYNREKKIKDLDPKNRTGKEKPKKKKGFSLLQRINYKLSKIKEEILNLGNKIKMKSEEKKKALKQAFIANFKK